jgi:hypothetical protein
MGRVHRVATAIGAFGLAACVGAATVGAQAPQTKPPQTKAPAATAKPADLPAIDPAAVAAVDRMGDYIKALKAFSIQAETSTDEVLMAGPKVQYGGSVDLTYRFPDKMRMRVVRDDMDDQQFFYDGATLAFWVEAKKTYATAPLTGLLPDAIATVEQKYDVTFPLGDLLSLAARKELLKNVQAGIVVGTGRVNGVECDHLGFHQDGADWQLWIEKGDRPLPRKLVITTLTEPTQPQHEVEMTWNLSPPAGDTNFTFTPPEGAQRIVIAERPATPAPSKKEVK